MSTNALDYEPGDHRAYPVFDDETGEIVALTAVPDAPVPEIPDFEGKPVSTTKVRVASTIGLDFQNTVLKTDDVVFLVVEARVTGISHQVNERTGELERVQTLKAIEVTLHENGVIR